MTNSPNKRNYLPQIKTPEINSLINELNQCPSIQHVWWYLDRNIDSLYTNIRRRNRSYELNMDLNYLKKLDYYYENWLEKLDIPIIRIDADTIDLNNPEFLSLWFKQLLDLDFPKTQRVVKLAIT